MLACMSCYYLTVATSSAEAEYKALAEGTKEALWLKNVMGELGFQLQPIKLYL